jgi:phosphoenolpyruvate synthase/pyruvate phosphate dikinase
MRTYVLGLQEVGASMTELDRNGDAAALGGKGANLGKLSRLVGILKREGLAFYVPAGFCVTTAAFQRVVADAPVSELLDRLSSLEADDHQALREVSAELRRTIEATPIPEEIRDEILSELGELGAEKAYAVRSSASAEDLPGASFAGLHDSYLNVRGTEEVLGHIRRCWASLFTDRAVVYRNQQPFLSAGVTASVHRQALMAVVVQRMVPAEAAGVLFTADPITGHRKVTIIEAVSGLGERLVSGLANAHRFKLREGRLLETGGLLTKAQARRLETLGRRIEGHFGWPQDIEWCLLDDCFHVVQSRPITTLFPLPERDDLENRVYMSVGHQQMMTDPLKPLGLSLYQANAVRPMVAAGGRLFVDPTAQLRAPASRQALLSLMGADPLFQDALLTAIERDDFLPPHPPEAGAAVTAPGSMIGHLDAEEHDPAVVDELITRSRALLEDLKKDIHLHRGCDLLDFILEDIGKLKAFVSTPQTIGAIMTGLNASAWLDDKMREWLGEKNTANTLSQSAPGNVTSEMGLELLDLADAIRPYPEVVAFLETTAQDDFLDRLPCLAGGEESRRAIVAYLDKYGMRCAGEIDVTRPRWSEKPRTLVPLILANVASCQPGEGQRRFEQGKQQAQRLAQDLLARLRQLPDGEAKAAQTERKIAQLRSFIGYREYPKYHMVNRYFVYRQALLQEAKRLLEAGVIGEVEDMDYVTLPELREVIRTSFPGSATLPPRHPEIIHRRKAEHALHQKLTPPRVMTSDGEVFMGTYRRADLPPGALAGLAVSSGLVEGRARVLLDMAEADLQAGDILVTTFTDPGWTPVFVSIAALVTEIGGLTSHGAVVAREYGLPAVVGVTNATKRIRDGQRIRVHGTEGYVELLD